MNPLQRLGERGQSVWLDFISRDLVNSDQLSKLVESSNVTGLTSNPTIFQKAMAEGDAYDAEIHELLDAGTTDPDEVFWTLAIDDIRAAADAMRGVWERTEHADGFVSLEVSPAIAHDTEATVAMARELWRRVDRPNLMIKIPATAEGIPAIRETIAAGINVNVTLIFALDAYARVIDAYLSGLESLRQSGGSLDVHSVASFFVSRVDTDADKRLEKLGNTDLQGRAAIANAVLAYELFEREFRDGERFAALRAAGAVVQRPLWASTSAKNPKYRDVLYAEALVGPDTVDTMPPATIDAFRDHGVVDGDSVRSDYAGAHRVIDDLRSAGVDINDVTTSLLKAGVASFAASFEELIGGLGAKIDAMRGGYGKRISFTFGDDAELISRGIEEHHGVDMVRRIWARDADLWKPGNADAAGVIANRLGWLDVTQTMRAAMPRLTALRDRLVADGIRDVVLLGMGGSSLCPEVLRAAFGPQSGHPTLHVLDTTDPTAIRDLGAAITPATTVFIVASKSGKTLETWSHYRHFWEMCVSSGVDSVGNHFVAVTDPGSRLAEAATSNGFAELFLNPADIGGRYSALSFFGLVPAACAGFDIDHLLRAGEDMRIDCAAGMPAALNGGLQLGTAMGELAAIGRNKVTIVAPPQIAAFSLWAEQLIAESTGKEGRGLIPVGDEPLGEPAVYADDRLFVVLSLPDAPAAFTAAVERLRSAGQPVLEFQLQQVTDLGAEFFRWEFATAIAGSYLQIDPFDEPNVQESKDNTNAVLAQFVDRGSLTEEAASVSEGDLSIYGETGATPSQALNQYLDQAHAGDYVALMAYVTPDAANDAALQGLRVALRDRLRLATTLGFGPRFLHSTGQLHKGGPNTGVYIQLTGVDSCDVAIPDQPYTFTTLKQAQADGDLASLRHHGRRVVRLRVGGNFAAGVDHLTAAVASTAGAAQR